MLNTHSYFRRATLCLLTCTVVFFMLEAFTPRLKNALLTSNGSAPENIAVPFERSSTKPNPDIKIIGEFDATPFTFTKVRLVVDDCLLNASLNGKSIPLGELSRNKLCNISTGTPVNLSSLVRPGSNILETHFKDDGGSAAFRIIRSRQSLGETALAIVIAACLVVASYFFARAAKLDATMACLLAGGIAIRLIYLDYSGIGDRAHDPWAHLDYIRYIAQHWRLPPNDACFECHQPPLYYLAAGAASALAASARFSDPNLPLQLLSLAAYFIFMIYGARTITLLVSERRRAWLATALFVFWPSAILHSVRVGNDSFFYMFYGAGLYYISQWWISPPEDREQFLFRASICAALAIFTKTSGLLLVGLIGIALCYRIARRDPISKLWRESSKALGILALGAIAFYFLAFYRQGVSPLAFGDTAGNLNKFNWIGKELRVGNAWTNMAYFSVPTFIEQPFVNGIDDALGRQYFWNFLAKSSLFGEWSIRQPNFIMAALLLGWSFLAIVSVSLLRLTTITRDERQRYLPLLWNSLLMLAAIMLYRYRYPIAANSDFRFILPSLIITCSLYASAKFTPRLSEAISWIGLLFITLSVLMVTAFWFTSETLSWGV